MGSGDKVRGEVVEGADEDKGGTSKVVATVIALCGQVEVGNYVAIAIADVQDEDALVMKAMTAETEVPNCYRGTLVQKEGSVRRHGMGVVVGYDHDRDRWEWQAEAVLTVPKDRTAAGKLMVRQDWLPRTNLVVLWAGDQISSFCVFAKAALLGKLGGAIFQLQMRQQKAECCWMSHPVIPSASQQPQMQPQMQLRQTAHPLPRLEADDPMSQEILLLHGKPSGRIPPGRVRKVEVGVYMAEPCGVR